MLNAKLSNFINLVFVSCMLISLMIIVSCGKKEVKVVSEDSKIATEAFALAKAIKEAYVKRDMVAIKGNATKDGYRTVFGEIKDFDSAELTFNPVWVEIKGNVVHLSISWKGTWQKDGKTIDDMGMAVFVLKGRPLKVDNVLRTNPFRFPE